MAFENEQKFLLKNDSWKKVTYKKSAISQGYIDIQPNTIELLEEGNSYFLSVNIPNFKITKEISKTDFFLLKENLHQEYKVVRVRQHDDLYFLTIKIDIGVVGSKIEVEPSLTKNEFEHLFKFTTSSISKVRNYVDYKNQIIEIDEFSGKNEGLVLAEIETNEVNEGLYLPDWIGENVTTDPKYYNYNLSK